MPSRDREPPDDLQAAAHAARGRALAAQRRWVPAAAALGAALRLQPNDARIARDCAAALALAGDVAAAAAVAEAVPGCGPVLHAFGQLLFRARRWMDAAGVLAQAASALSGDAAVLHDLGIALHEAGEFAAAAEAYERALALDPQRAPTWHNLGSLRQRQGDMAAAMRAYGRAYALEPRGFGRIAQELAAGNPGRIWLRAEDLRRELIAADETRRDQEGCLAP